MVSPETRAGNQKIIHSFLKKSYELAKDQLRGGMNLFRDEWNQLTGTAEECVSFLLLPVNNFLKDLAQINREFAGRSGPEPGITPLKEAVNGSPVPEENY